MQICLATLDNIKEYALGDYFIVNTSYRTDEQNASNIYWSTVMPQLNPLMLGFKQGILSQEACENAYEQALQTRSIQIGLDLQTLKQYTHDKPVVVMCQNDSFDYKNKLAEFLQGKFNVEVIKLV